MNNETLNHILRAMYNVYEDSKRLDGEQIMDFEQFQTDYDVRLVGRHSYIYNHLRVCLNILKEMEENLK